MTGPALTTPIAIAAIISALMAIAAKAAGYDTLAAIAGVLLIFALAVLPATWRR